MKKRSSVEQTEDDINTRSNKIHRVSETAILVDSPNKNKDAILGSSRRNDCSSMMQQSQQPSTPIFESMVVVSAGEEIATKNRTSCADEQEIKKDEEEEGSAGGLLQHLSSSSLAICTKEPVPSSGMVSVSVSDSVKGNNSKIGSYCSFCVEAVAFNTSTSGVWSKNLSEITLQKSSTVKHPHQEQSCQKKARINIEEDVFLDPFEMDLEPVPLGPSSVVLGSSALPVVRRGSPAARCPSIDQHLFLGCAGFDSMASSRDVASILSCGDDQITSPLATFLAKRNAYNEAAAILNDAVRPSDSFFALVEW